MSARGDRKTKCYKTLSVILMLFLVVSPVFAGGSKTRTFTNEDLEKYKFPSDSSPSPDSRSPITTQNPLNNATADPLENAQKLKQYVIPYTAYEGSSRRIIIPVTFNGWVTAPMLLDTGAPGVHISQRLAEKLGVLDNEEGKLWINISGVGGTVPAIYTVIESISAGEAETRFVPIVVSQSISNDFEGLIGMDFMANYSIRIDTKKHVLVLEEMPQSPDRPAGHDEEWWRLTFYNFKKMKASWESYKKMLDNRHDGTSQTEELRQFAEKQYRSTDDLLNKLRGFAGEHSVPQEWR